MLPSGIRVYNGLYLQLPVLDKPELQHGLVEELFKTSKSQPDRYSRKNI